MDTKLFVLIIVVIVAIALLCSCYREIQEYFKSEHYQEPSNGASNTSATTSGATSSPSNAVTVSNSMAAPNFGDGIYAIKNYQSIDLTSAAFTPVQCNNFVIGTSRPSTETNWRIKNIVGQPGVIQLVKPQGNECLFAGLDNQLKSYFWSDASCPKRTNLCGLDTSDYRGDLDPQSMPTYFRILNSSTGGYLIQSLETNKFICLQNNQVSMQVNPNSTCVFSINRA